MNESSERREAEQRRATDPTASVWVAASAGTGKTQVLTDRYLSLLLAGTEPQRVLCLTFTRAAAAEMANRIGVQVARWPALPDAALDKELKALAGVEPDEETHRRARRLLVRLLDTPGGMKIETIHGFCQSLLRRFPIEAEVAPHFELLDERSAAELLRDAREQVLARARAGAEGLAQALRLIGTHAGEDAFAELLRMLAAERARFRDLLARHGGLGAAKTALRDLLGLEPGANADSLLAEACEDDSLDLMGLGLAVEALEGGGVTDRGRAAAIAAWLAAPAERGARFADYKGAFLTATGEIREVLATEAVRRRDPHAVTVLEHEARRVLDLRERLNAALVGAMTEAVMELGEAILGAYERLKETRALLDYDDLILLARDLLRRPGVAPWVLYKLDGGLDHILIDEAQDTNPEQWDVIALLADEFFAGEGASAGPRTVFAVGDVKQSIFGFQRADPNAFLRMREHFRARVEAARRAWHDVPLAHSYRSVPAVLRAVDAIFEPAAARDGVALDGRAIIHEAHREGQAGLVELWPPATPAPVEEVAAWQPPVGRLAGDRPRARLARLVAGRIAAMIASGERLPSRGRAVRPGDVMILVRRRDALVEELVRELKERQVPVAGVDRMVLTDQIAVMDLVTLGRFLLLPEDDLTLATVLKSPLVGLDEEQLFRLAYRRQGSLWAALRRDAADAALAPAAALLRLMLARADYVRPYELYAELLGRLGGRRALLQRLGPEAADPIDEFLNLALHYERAHVPSLQGFLHWLAAGAVEVKRDLEQGAGQVRVMTVHGAKGLQAPIVFLPDSMQIPKASPRLLWHASPQLPLMSPRVAEDDSVTGAARARARQLQDQEHRRLLYVALTRAEDRLYVCGWRGRNQAPQGCWYDLVAEGLKPVAAPFEFDCVAELGPTEGWRGPGFRLADPQTAAPDPPEEAEQAAPPAAPLPSWALLAPELEPTPARPLAPSRPPGEEPPVLAPLGDARYRRGRLVHRLLELLPDLPDERRAAACRRLLAAHAPWLDAADGEAIGEAVLRLIADPRFAALFGPGSMAEVPLVGEVSGPDGRPVVVSGRIDRLVVAEEVLAVDYKADRAPAAAMPETYLWQMAAYRAVLRRIYPDRPITCGILWTTIPDLVVLSAGDLDRWLP